MISRRLMRGCLVYILASVIAISLVGCLVILPMLLIFSADGSPILLLVPLGLFFVIMFGGGGGFIWWSLSRRAKWMDAAFTPLGLTGKSYMMTGRSYTGTISNRPVSIQFLRGPLVTFSITTPIPARFGIGEQGRLTGPVARLMRQEPLETSDPDFANYVIYPENPNWMRQLLANPHAKQRILHLMADDGPADIRQVLGEAKNNQLMLRLYENKNLFKYEITPDQARRWMSELLALAEIVEQQGEK